MGSTPVDACALCIKCKEVKASGIPCSTEAFSYRNLGVMERSVSTRPVCGIKRKKKIGEHLYIFNQNTVLYYDCTVAEIHRTAYSRCLVTKISKNSLKSTRLRIINF
jgi:hypothetical protein